jgi:NAD(P)-dependent dehydrogenase (short-subunit alcohol dehydrogenase family)
MGGVSAGAVVVITGGARGLGLGTAKALTSRGARIALIDRDADAVHAAAQSLGGGSLGVAADICDAAAVSDAIAQIADRFGAIDVVMACAGITGWGPALLIDRSDWERTIETNLLGTWRTVKAALPHLVRSKGYLLIVASGLAASPGPGASAYAASKAAVESLGRSLRIELAHHGVDVGVAYYSFLDTPMVDAIERNPAAMRARAAMPAPVRRTYPIDKAAAATAAGIEHRAPRIIYPGFLRWALLLRGFFGPRSDKPAIKAMPEVERLTADHQSSEPPPVG